MLVTGAGGALGSAICARLAREGHVVAACDIDGARLQRCVDEVRAQGGEIFAVEGDIRQSVEVARVFSEVSRQVRAPTIFVHCAGTPGRFAFLSELSDDDWSDMIATHLSSAFYAVRAAAPAMREAGFGRIVNIVSLAGMRGTVGSGAYSAAKAALVGLTLTAAKEFGPWGVTANAIAPGMIATPPNLELQAKASLFTTSAIAETPSRAMSRPEDIAALIAFLVSPAACNINGQVIGHDGGAAIGSGIDEFMRARFEPGGVRGRNAK